MAKRKTKTARKSKPTTKRVVKKTATKKVVAKPAKKKKVVAKPVKKKKVAKKKKATKKVVAKKATKKVATKKAVTRGRRKADPKSPKFDTRKHIKLSDLAKKCGISYQSMYLKQKRTGIAAIQTNYNGVEVIAFSKADAKKLQSLNAKPMSKSSVVLKEIETELKISRPKLTNIMLKLRIAPVKRQGNDNRQTLTVTKSQYRKIKQQMQA